ncbi:hypothetical protein [Vibrio navarrensis]|uniref:hypothetical protein n=1 Tax=Vibrio navarrensis TaxID=29495 RepID=UPI001EEA72F8|nr:hypothetical protein [Vibrio navarrensis]
MSNKTEIESEIDTEIDTEIENKLENEEFEESEPLPREPVLISRKEIVQIFGRSGGFADAYIKKYDDFPEKVSRGNYRRKEVMAWLKDKGFI